MSRYFAKTHLRLGMKNYKPGEELPEMDDATWKRLTQKKAIETVVDPVGALVDDPGADETEGDEPGNENPGDYEGDKAAADPGKDDEAGDDPDEDEDGEAPELPKIDGSESVLHQPKAGKAGGKSTGSGKQTKK